MSGNKIMFVNEFQFTKNGRTGYGYNFVEFSKDAQGLKTGRTSTLFTNEKVDISNVQSGDIVTCDFAPSMHLGGKSSLCGIKVVQRLFE